MGFDMILVSYQLITFSSSSLSPSSCICHGVGPLVDPFRSHVHVFIPKEYTPYPLSTIVTNPGRDSSTRMATSYVQVAFRHFLIEDTLKNMNFKEMFEVHK